MEDGVEDQEVILQCLLAAADGPFFPDWEFSTLFGFEREEIRRTASTWPDTDDGAEHGDAINATPKNFLRHHMAARTAGANTSRSHRGSWSRSTRVGVAKTSSTTPARRASTALCSPMRRTGHRSSRVMRGRN